MFLLDGKTTFKRIRKKIRPFMACVRVDLVSASAMTRATRLTIVTSLVERSVLACDVGASSFPSFDTC
jgi:hypothetical protein